MNTFTQIVPVVLMVGLVGCKKETAEVPPPSPQMVVAPKLPAPAAAKPTDGRIELKVTADGFVPEKIAVKANEPVTLVVTRTTDETCATELLIDGTDINVPLPLMKPVEIAWTPTKTGAVKYGCAMDKMVSGILLVE